MREEEMERKERKSKLESWRGVCTRGVMVSSSPEDGSGERRRGLYAGWEMDSGWMSRS